MTPPAGADSIAFDHQSSEYAERWREIYADLRQRCPVAHSTTYDGFYLLTRYHDVERVLKDDVTFASKHVLGTEFKGNNIPESPGVATPIEMDPPEFTPLRRLLNPWFSPSKAKEWAPFVRDVTTAFLDAAVETGEIDIIDGLASPVPALLTAALLGLPLEDWRTYADAAHAIVYVPHNDPRFSSIVKQWVATIERATEIALQRRDDPRHDLISAIATNRGENGDLLSAQTIREMCSLIIAGGDDTTTGLIANALMWLSDHPAEKQWLLEDFDRINGACEEFLRYFTPTQTLARTVTARVEIGGRTLEPGDRVLISFAAANQDPEMFDNPDEIILDRSHNRHQAFGLGIHRCLGSNYTRMDFRVVLEEVLTRMPDLTVDRDRCKRYDNIGMVNGWERMTARFTPGPKRGIDFRL